MGADYYIFQYLQIYHTNGIAYIELFGKRGYFCDCLDRGYDSDTNSPEDYNAYKESVNNLYLTPSINPILIYNGNNYLNQRFEDKYDHLVNNKILDQPKYWKDTGRILEYKEEIISIYKIEVRQLI
jgi:hypothetical protein